jgi:signal transduction histidine kinase
VEVDRLKSEFVATVSHELRTPMTAIKGYVDILTMGAAGALNENQMHFLEVVRNNIDRLNILVSDLLDISRIESGTCETSAAAVNMYDIAEELWPKTCAVHRRKTNPLPLVGCLKNFPLVTGDERPCPPDFQQPGQQCLQLHPENGTILVNIRQEERRICRWMCRITALALQTRDQDAGL